MAAFDRKILNVQQFEGHSSIKSGQNCKQQVMIMNHPKRLFFIKIRITLVVSEFPNWWKVLANMLGLMTFLMTQALFTWWWTFWFCRPLLMDGTLSNHPLWQPLVSHKHWSLVYKSPQLASMESLCFRQKVGRVAYQGNVYLYLVYSMVYNC